jgi:hypothetical protein
MEGAELEVNPCSSSQFAATFVVAGLAPAGIILNSVSSMCVHVNDWEGSRTSVGVSSQQEVVARNL